MSEHTAEKDAPADVFGCPAVTDFRVKGGPVLLTRCSRYAGHPGQHNNPQTKRWPDSGTTWLIRPASVIPPGSSEAVS